MGVVGGGHFPNYASSTPPLLIALQSGVRSLASQQLLVCALLLYSLFDVISAAASNTKVPDRITGLLRE